MPGRLLTQVEAARLVGCSRDTILRARRAGRFPAARLEAGRWVIPTEDLVAAGLYDPAGPDADGAHSISSTDPVGPEDVALQLARAETRVAGLEEVVARQDDELRFLRATVESLTKRTA